MTRKHHIVILFAKLLAPDSTPALHIKLSVNEKQSYQSKDCFKMGTYMCGTPTHIVGVG